MVVNKYEEILWKEYLNCLRGLSCYGIANIVGFQADY